MGNIVYDVNKHACLIGIFPISLASMSEGGKLTITWDEQWGKKRDAGGGVHIYGKGGPQMSGMVKLPLIQTSADNAAMGALMNIALGSRGGTSGVFSCIDGNGGSIIVATFALVKPPASYEIGQEPSDVEWEIEIGGASFQPIGIP